MVREGAERAVYGTGEATSNNMKQKKLRKDRVRQKRDYKFTQQLNVGTILVADLRKAETTISHRVK